MTVRKYNYTEEKFEHLIFQSFDYDESRNEVPVPPWWDKKEVDSKRRSFL